MAKPKHRIILHIDLDAFFASVEIRERPELKGKPVVIGADPKEGKGRGVVSTASYEARKFGIHSAMPISTAYKLCPTAVFLPVNMELYLSFSEKVMKILREFADKFEQASIDEAYLDISGRVKNPAEAEELARKIKKEILEKEKLTSSIGIGPNKLIAKIASDFQKPDGLTVVTASKIKEFLNQLGVRKLPGIGPKSEESLKEMEIRTIGELANYPAEKLIERFGKYGLYIHQSANGIDEDEVEESYEIKSASRQITFEKDVDASKSEGQEITNRAMDGLSEDIFEELKSEGFMFRTVGVKVRYSDFETHTAEKSQKFPLQDLNAIKNTAKELLKKFISEKKIRLIGIKVSNLSREGQARLK